MLQVFSEYLLHLPAFVLPIDPAPEVLVGLFGLQIEGELPEVGLVAVGGASALSLEPLLDDPGKAVFPALSHYNNIFIEGEEQLRLWRCILLQAIRVGLNFLMGYGDLIYMLDF